MGTFEIVITIICLIAYTIFAVWAITKCKKLSTGIASSICLAAGSVGVYFAASVVAVVLMWLLKAVLIIGAIALVLYLFGG